MYSCQAHPEISGFPPVPQHFLPSPPQGPASQEVPAMQMASTGSLRLTSGPHGAGLPSGAYFTPALQTPRSRTHSADHAGTPAPRLRLGDGLRLHSVLGLVRGWSPPGRQPGPSQAPSRQQAPAAPGAAGGSTRGCSCWGPAGSLHLTELTPSRASAREAPRVHSALLRRVPVTRPRPALGGVLAQDSELSCTF